MRLYTACIVLLLLLCSISTALAVDNEDSRASLKGLPGVSVLVEELKPEVEQAGLRAAEIQTDVELRLRLAGIPVLSQAQMFLTPGQPFLYISVIVATRTTTDLWPVSVELQLRQNVQLERSPATKVEASTWDYTFASSVGRLNLRSIRDGSIKDEVDKFINAYLAVNPKK
jgi:hypothetical protein